ncbi:MAG: hypothetical protein H0X33_14195 [Taibaiella sp.]|nr:hypothetical protein [Taibaiella sp.]
MSCCPTISKTFINQSVTAIPYSGDIPDVSVVYFIGGQLVIDSGSEIKFKDGMININHGGPASGFILIK